MSLSNFKMRDSKDFTEIPDFTTTDAYSKLIGFLEDTNYKIMKSPCNNERSPCASDGNITGILEKINSAIETTDLEPGSHRFANSAALRIFEFTESISVSENFEKKISPENSEILSIYLNNSFGNKIRFDYGTGHEINFLCFLYVASRLSLVALDEMHQIWKKYFQVIREFIFKFNIEPAGSNGIFAIDDYSFLPFYFGSAELIKTEMKFENLFEPENSNLLYAEAVNFCKRHKCKLMKSSFSKHSAVIYELRKHDWQNINDIMMKMIREKVFGRSVVMQHFKYSEYLGK